MGLLIINLLVHYGLRTYLCGLKKNESSSSNRFKVKKNIANRQDVSPPK